MFPCYTHFPAIFLLSHSFLSIFILKFFKFSIFMVRKMSHFDLTRKFRKHLKLAFGLCALTLIWSTRILGPSAGEVKTMMLDHVVSPYRPIYIGTKMQQVDLSHMESIVKTPTFEYSRRVIRTKHFDGDRPELTRISEALTSPPMIIQKTSISETPVPRTPVLTLRVPNSPKSDTSIFNFGIATRISRLKLSIPQISHWLSNSDAQLHVLAPHDEEMELVQSQMKHEGMDVTITPTPMLFAKTYFLLIKILYESRTPSTKYLVLIDDDTFFPSLSSLADHFTRKYNPADHLLVTATSDNLGQIHTFGLQPFGGGGVFISLPLAAFLLQPSVWDNCMNSTKNQGDQIVNDCLNSYSDVRPIFDPLLHQMDINGDTLASAPEAGYLESGRKMLSLHHWKSWFQFDIPEAANVTKACGDEGLFQRWLFDGNMVLNNGYSIAEYPLLEDADGNVKGGITEEELRGVEYTWHGGEEKEKWRFVHMMSPLRPMKTKAEKKTKILVEAVEVMAPEGRGIRQIYIDRWKRTAANEEGIWNETERDKVVELLWLI